MGRVIVLALAGLLCGSGCRTDLSHQLLERELRMQEDQIYQLQDELQDACARLDRTAGENRSLRRQLGFTDGDAVAPAPAATPPGRRPAPTPAEPLMVPPAISIPGGPAPRAPAAPTIPETIAPPKLDGVPPLPVEPKFSGADAGSPEPGPGLVTPAANAAEARPMPAPATAGPTAPVRRLSYEESLAVAGTITHVVVNAARTECFDTDGDGVSDGLTIVIEPRDDQERLVTAGGDVAISVHDLGGTAAAVARWNIPAQQALAHFRRTSRHRGLCFVLRWPGQPPAGDHVRVHVSLAAPQGAPFETDCTVPLTIGSNPPASPLP